MTYTRVKGEGSYKRANWEKFYKVIMEQFHRLCLLTFEGKSTPSIPSKHKFAQNHWDTYGSNLGFYQLMTVFVDINWVNFNFKFYDKYDEHRYFCVEVDCHGKILKLSGSYDNKDKLFQALGEIKDTFEFDKDFDINEYINRKNVFVIHGRNTKIKDELFEFLKAAGLKPIEWSEAVSKTREGAPYIGKILDEALSSAQALLALLTPDELVQLKPEFVKKDDPSYERGFRQQPRPNVLFEAGMAFGLYPERTILVEFGKLRPFSDILGRHTIRLDNSPKMKRELVSRLRTAGCEIKQKESDWLNIGDFDLDKK